MPSLRSRYSNSQSSASQQIDDALLDMGISVTVLEVLERSSVRFPSMSTACNSQIGVSSSAERREMAYMFTEDIKADKVAKFLDHLAKETASNMPNYTKKNVYETYRAEVACI